MKKQEDKSRAKREYSKASLQQQHFAPFNTNAKESFL